jgi:hypothetical protein
MQYMSEPSVWIQMAELADAAADTVLNGIPVDQVRRFDQSRFELDQIEFRATFESDEPATWIAEISGSYLSEAGRELEALAVLIRNEALTGSIEVVVRAVVERVGKINWVLDHTVDSRTRALRAGLELAVSYQHYRRAVEDLGARQKIIKPLVAQVRQQRAQLEGWFVFSKPPSNPCDPESSPSPDPALWTVGDEAFPTFEKLTHYAMGDGGVPYRPAKGTYGALSCFSHPNVVASWEHRRMEGEDDRYISYTYTPTYVERLIRTAIVGVGNAFSRWLGYFDNDHDRLHAKMSEILSLWEALSPDVEAITADS